MNAIETFALQLAIGALGVSGLTLAAAGLLRRRSEPLRYGILLTGVIALLAAPALVGLGQACQSALPVPEPDEEIVRVSMDMLPALLGRPQADAPAADNTASTGWRFGAGLLALWLLGTLISMSRLLRALLKQRRALAGRPWQAAFWTDERRALLARGLGLKRFPPVYVSPVVPMPMVIGIWRPTIVLPEAAPPTWQQEQWEAVLLHEAAHIARGDPWAVLAERLAIALFWWCPLVYVLARRLDALRENICDDCALAGNGDPIAYAELLVDSAEHFLRLTALPAPLGLLDSARRGLEARVSRLLDKEKPTMTRLSLSGKLLGAACLMLLGLLTTAGTAFSGGQDPPPKKIQIKIVIDGKEIDLSDPQLWQHIEAAQKKATGVRDQVVRDTKVFRADKPALAAHPDRAKVLAFGPDGRVLLTGDGKRIVVLDGVTGRIVWQQENPGRDWEWRYLSQVQSKADPRVEELVKQAEAIKPGSGDAVRKAMQAAPKAGDAPHQVRPAKPAPGTSGLRLWSEDHTGKKVIVLDIGDGKVLRLDLKAEDIHKLLDKGTPLRIELDLQKKIAAEKAHAIELLYKAAKDKTGAGRPTPQQGPVNLEALSRQLERLNAEVNELRKRLDAGKK